jgi:very-short-patch-repair endonuclease
VTRRQVERRLQSGHLHVVHRGVYAVGTPVLQPLAAELAAVLACGPTAHLSHRSAAVVWGLLPPRPGPIHVTVSGPRRRGPATVRLHHTTRPDAAQHHGIPLTSAVRTLQDLDPDEQDRATNEAIIRRLIPRPAHGAQPTRSEAERRLLGLLRAARLPPPRTNVRVAGHEVDAHWPREGLVVEVDGYAFHGTRQAFERDRRRDADLVAAGLRVLRVSWRQLTGEPTALAARLGAALEVARARSEVGGRGAG